MDFTKAKRNLERNGFEVHVFKTGAEAAAHLNEELNDVSIGFGGSKTLDQLGLYESLSEHNDVYWHWRQDADYAREKSMNTDIYMSSANGLAETGEIIFVDGNGNRVAASICGPKRVVYVIGRNKIVDGGVDEAIARIRRCACPPNAKRLGKRTPCGLVGACVGGAGCDSPDRMCKVTAVFDRKPTGISAKVILVDEDLGY